MQDTNLYKPSPVSSEAVTLTQPVACLHCRQPVETSSEKLGSARANDDRFCCQGCQTVYSLLNSCGLSDYYSLRDQLGTVRPATPVQASASGFAYLDDVEQVQPLVDQNGLQSLEFYLEGVHCAACIWLVEKLPEYVAGVQSARLNLSNSTARVTIAPDARFEPVAKMLANWGYRPHVITQSAETEKLARRDQVLMLSRIGIAAFASGNLMILSVALYSGLSGPLAHYFEWLSLLLAAPAVTFSAWPFYRQAWGQIRHSRQISIDVPIALSLLLGTLGGIYELVWGTRQIYFDSLAMLVFLLLFSRYALMRTQQTVLRQDRLLAFYTPEAVDRLESDQFVSVSLNQLNTGDVIRVKAGMRLPADGQVISGEALLDMSVLTGEAFPQPVKPGDDVYCGTHNQQGELLVKLAAMGTASRLGQILLRSQANLEEKTRLVRLADRLARRFVGLVLTLAGVLCLVFVSHPQTALVRVLALAIISCPCALALATPLMVQISLKRALARGFFVRKAESLERLPDVQTIVFDKTGTLTQGRFELLTSEGLTPEISAAIIALETRSPHPVARALVLSLSHTLAVQHTKAAEVEDFENLPQGGVTGRTADGTRWSIYPDPDYRPAADSEAEANVSAGHVMVRLIVSKGTETVASLLLGDRLRPEAPATIAELQAMGYQTWLLSGDQPAACAAIAQAVGIAPENVLSRQTPEAKEAFFKAHPDAVMVGDGINDMLAMSKAKVGVSVQGSAEENLQSADIYLAEKGIGQLPALLRHASLTRNMLRLALGFSLTYNFFGISAAVLGFVTPLIAAVVMPLSALTVTGIALIGGRLLCRS